MRATEPELLAYHFQEAGNRGAAFASWIAAGDVAEQRGVPSEEKPLRITDLRSG